MPSPSPVTSPSTSPAKLKNELKALADSPILGSSDNHGVDKKLRSGTKLASPTSLRQLFDGAGGGVGEPTSDVSTSCTDVSFWYQNTEASFWDTAAEQFAESGVVLLGVYCDKAADSTFQLLSYSECFARNLGCDAKNSVKFRLSPGHPDSFKYTTGYSIIDAFSLQQVASYDSTQNLKYDNHATSVRHHIANTTQYFFYTAFIWELPTHNLALLPSSGTHHAQLQEMQNARRCIPNRHGGGDIVYATVVYGKSRTFVPWWSVEHAFELKGGSPNEDEEEGDEEKYDDKDEDFKAVEDEGSKDIIKSTPKKKSFPCIYKCGQVFTSVHKMSGHCRHCKMRPKDEDTVPEPPKLDDDIDMDVDTCVVNVEEGEHPSKKQRQADAHIDAIVI